MAARSAQRGSTILEALISILLFSIGILAIIGLQAVSIKNSADAKYRTDASLLANQVIGQMWVSDKSNLAANFNSPDGAAYQAWAGNVAATMPGVSSSPLYQPTISVVGSAVTVTVHWLQPGESTAHQYVTVATVN